MRVVIVDDEKPARERVRRLLQGHADFVVVGEAADAPSAVALIDQERPDLCFLDVQMPAGDAFEVLRRAQHVPRTIFTTAYDQYAVRAFEVNSVYYLLKPFSPKRFAAALDRAREQMGRNTSPGGELARLLEAIRAGLPGLQAGGSDAPARIPARRGAKILLRDPSDVLWFEAEETLVFARTAEGRFVVERTISELEAWLGPSFFRAQRQYLVNLSRVGEIEPHESGTYRIVMRDVARTVLPLSRRQATRLRERIPW